MANYESHLDDEPLITGTHYGSNGAAALYDPNALFQTVGVDGELSQAIYNDTQVTNGNVTSATDTTVESDITWNNGDTYSIYKTSTKDSFISRIGVDRSRGWKTTERSELNIYGWFPEDVDIDKNIQGNILPRRERPFSPNSPAANNLKRSTGVRRDSSNKFKRKRGR